MSLKETRRQLGVLQPHKQIHLGFFSVFAEAGKGTTHFYKIFKSKDQNRREQFQLLVRTHRRSECVPGCQVAEGQTSSPMSLGFLSVGPAPWVLAEEVASRAHVLAYLALDTALPTCPPTGIRLSSTVCPSSAGRRSRRPSESLPTPHPSAVKSLELGSHHLASDVEIRFRNM